MEEEHFTVLLCRGFKKLTAALAPLEALELAFRSAQNGNATVYQLWIRGGFWVACPISSFLGSFAISVAHMFGAPPGLSFLGSFSTSVAHKGDEMHSKRFGSSILRNPMWCVVVSFALLLMLPLRADAQAENKARRKGPRVVQFSDNRLQVFIRNGDGETCGIKVNSGTDNYEGGAWNGWGYLGGDPTPVPECLNSGGNPAVAITQTYNFPTGWTDRFWLFTTTDFPYLSSVRNLYQWMPTPARNLSETDPYILAHIYSDPVVYPYKKADGSYLLTVLATNEYGNILWYQDPGTTNCFGDQHCWEGAGCFAGAECRAYNDSNFGWVEPQLVANDRKPTSQDPANIFTFFLLGSNRQILMAQSNGGALNSWTWSDLGGQLYSNPAVVRNVDGTYEVFAIGGDRAVWHVRQNCSGCAWGRWTSLRGELYNNPSAVVDANGVTRVFALGKDGAIWTIQQSSPGSQYYTTWYSLGGTLWGDPTAFKMNDGRIAVFALAPPDRGGDVWWLRQRYGEGNLRPGDWYVLEPQ